MTDQEGEVKLFQNRFRDHRRVFRLRTCVARMVRDLLAMPITLHSAIHMPFRQRTVRIVAVGAGTVRGTVGGRFGRSDTTLDSRNRRGNRRRLAVWRDQVIGNVFDEEALALEEGK